MTDAQRRRQFVRGYLAAIQNHLANFGDMQSAALMIRELNEPLDYVTRTQSSMGFQSVKMREAIREAYSN